MGAPLSLLEILGGLVFSALIGAIGYKRQALDTSGVLGAIITGALIFGLGGWAWGLLLIAFFVSSSALSFYRAGEKEGLAEKFAKDHRRDLGQALANGGAVAGLALLSRILPFDRQTAGLYFAACAGAMAAVNADTWATELGVLSTRPPRLITNGKRVEIGSSGGVTWTGIAASFAGASLIGLLSGASAMVLGRGWEESGLLMCVAIAGGMSGSLFDSWLGATVQAIYWCDTCQKETERTIHRCGAETRPLRGWGWLNNDLVNFLASMVGALVAAGLYGGWRF